MRARGESWRRRHPVLWSALLWSTPALAFGLLLRVIFLHYSPYAYWGADSPSFFGFTNGVLSKFYFSINEKRRYLYPVFLLPISLLPGGTLRWLGWIQAGLGLISLLPLTYIVRRIFPHWRWWIIPVSLLYTGLPLLLWQEHELIADTIFFDFFNWMIGGWVAWTVQTNPARGRRLFWWFLVPTLLMMLTKPSGLFFWPGIGLGLLLVGAWRTLRWPEWAAVAATIIASLTVAVSDHKQSAWLLYSTAFPLTVMESPLHQDYKAQVKDLVEKKRARINAYFAEDDEVNRFVRGPEDPTRPLWSALPKDSAKMIAVYHDLAMEAIKAHPDLFVMIGVQRMLGSCNPGDFRESRLGANYFAERFEDTYNDKRIPESMLRIAFGIPKSATYPTLDELKPLIAPDPDSTGAKWIKQYAHAYAAAGKLVERPEDENAPLTQYRPAFAGWWVLAGLVLSLFPAWRRTLGIWALAAVIYLFGVYLVGIQQTRYFGVLWPVVILLLAVVPESLLGLAKQARAWRLAGGESGRGSKE